MDIQPKEIKIQQKLVRFCIGKNDVLPGMIMAECRFESDLFEKIVDQLRLGPGGSYNFSLLIRWLRLLLCLLLAALPNGASIRS